VQHLNAFPADFLRRAQLVKGALCGVFDPDLRASCLQSGRGWADN
jgi:hypothetical protein